MTKILKTAKDTKSIYINGLKATVILTTLLSASVSHALDFEVGGTKASVYGYAQATFTYDLDHDLGRDTFGLSSLPATSDQSGSKFNAHADQTRLGLTTQTGKVKTKIEGDFYGNGGGGFRLRHGYGEYGNWLAGQTWTNFMPLDAYPGSLDFQGPAGVAFSRKTQLRYTTGGLSVSIEDAATNSDQPALTAAYKLKAGDRSLRIAGLLNSDVKGATAGQEDDAYGITVSGTTPLWEGGNLGATYISGKGIGDYMVFGGDALDASGDAIDTEGYTLGLTQKVGNGKVGLSYGKRENDTGTVGSTKSLETIHVNYTIEPVKNVSVGIEYFTGERELFGGGTSDADRILSTWRYSF